MNHLKSLNNHVALQNLYIYHTWKNIIKQYKKNRLKIIAPTWNDEFELPNGSYSVSGIKECIIKRHEQQLTSIPPIQNRYKLELQTSETMKLFGSTKIINRQNKKRRKSTKS